MSFADIPLRLNGQQILFSWFNLLRQAGIDLEGGQDQEFVMVDGQATFADITGLVLDKTTFSTATMLFTIRRKKTGDGRREVLDVTQSFESELDDWTLDADVRQRVGLASQVEFQVTSAGQIQYKNTAMGGALPKHTITWSIIKKVGIES